MYIYIIIFLCVLLLVTGYIIRNLYVKNSLYEGWIVQTRQNLLDVKTNWRKLDTNQMFEKDDEVGATFEEINELIQNLNEKVEDE